MRSVRSWWVRLRNVFRKAPIEQDLREELESNIRIEIDEYVRTGLTVEEARRLTLARYGSLDSVKERMRDRHGLPFLETTVRDVRYALRALGQNKGWTAVAILSLALGIGVNTALFNILNGVLLEKLPVRSPDELVALRWVGETNMANGRSGFGYVAPANAAPDAESQPREATFSYRVFQTLRTEAQPLAGLFAASYIGSLNVFAAGHSELALGEVVSGNLYHELGIAPVSGRLIEPADDAVQADPVAVISYGYWQRRFNMDPSVVGSSITINTVPFTIVGITPKDFTGIVRNSTPRQITIPLALEERIQRQSQLRRPANWWLMVMGRLRPGAHAEQLEAALQGVYDRSVREEWPAALASFPPARRALPEFAQREDRVAQLRIVPGNRGVYDVLPSDKDMVGLLQGIAGMVLLLVAVNLANLLLSRGAVREREIIIRLAIGAGRRRVIRQLLTESIVLAAIGGIIGVLPAYWFRTVFAVQLGLPPAEMEWIVFGFALAVTTATGLAFGLVPAVRATGVNLSPGTRGGADTNRSRHRLSRALLTAQVAISVVLLFGAGLFLRTLWNLHHVDIGFNTDNIVLFGVNPAANQYDATQTAALFDNVLETIPKVPGVKSVTLSSTALLTGDNSQGRFGIEGRTERVPSYVLSIHDNYLQTMQIPLKLGRNFTASDNASAPRVAIVNEAFAGTYFPGMNPIGKHLEIPDRISVEIVGVAGDTKFATLRPDPPPTVFMPHLQRPTSRFFAARTDGDAAALIPAIRDAMRRIDSKLPLQFIATQAESISQTLSTERTFAVSSGMFGVLALAVSTIGLFGLMSYTVARRTKEIGIRIALGANRGAVLKSIIREALILVTAGSIIGLGIAAWLSKFAAPQLFGLGQYDPATMAAAMAIMIAVGAFAAYLPARRASRVAPVVALRHE
jgi:predicted permease